MPSYTNKERSRHIHRREPDICTRAPGESAYRLCCLPHRSNMKANPLSRSDFLRILGRGRQRSTCCTRNCAATQIVHNPQEKAARTLYSLCSIGNVNVSRTLLTRLKQHHDRPGSKSARLGSARLSTISVKRQHCNICGVYHTPQSSICISVCPD